MQSYCNENAEESKIRKMQKDRVRELVKYTAKNLTPNDIDDAFNVVVNSITYKFLMTDETGLWRRPREEIVYLLKKEVNKDIDSWMDIIIQCNKCRQLMA